MNVMIRGGGVAAACCAHLLGLNRIAVTMAPADPAPAPVVMLSDMALGLIRDVFAAPDLFAGLPRITRRIVAWGGGDPVAMPHAATIVAGAAALLPVTETGGAATTDLTIHAAAPLPGGETRRFGARGATAAPVALRDPADASDCWIESVESGWLFLIPAGTGQAWLLSVGADMEAALRQSRHVARRVRLAEAPRQSFDPSPRIACPPSGADWIGCGTAAIAFDPICGDGTAQAVREAILVSAILAAIGDGGDAQALRAHHDAMLLATMRRHLQLCAPFYRTGGQGDWWRAAHDALAEGHDWCTTRLAHAPEPRYMLQGYRLAERRLVS
ncbi:hypothetical protein [Sphingomonas sanxanigenens]|uniref:FAD-binding domain-containing protein n=1 Tax=Sphingomonas sanxanigenens DSM 19645 = NX02 TaxID=1123269 RepID=W0AEQ4_9SPHN|nr:hypothetical protein [Sphingomonas sanxanigenens]AHE54783.1 hypothetical protein NX02_15510 [Sphingomonas sanxanigenens DSM 19645 = NX02]